MKKKSDKVLINLKTALAEKKSLEANAKKYADGNLSEWLRLAGLNYIPKPKKAR